MWGTNNSRRDYSSSQSSTQEKEFSTPLSCVEIITILDPVRQRFLFLVSMFLFFPDVLEFFFRFIKYLRIISTQWTNKKRSSKVLLLQYRKDLHDIEFTEIQIILSRKSNDFFFKNIIKKKMEWSFLKHQKKRSVLSFIRKKRF